MPNYLGLRYFHEFVNVLECSATPANVRELCATELSQCRVWPGEQSALSRELNPGYQTYQHNIKCRQATGLDAWASRVKCPARFVSHLHDICIYIWVVHSFCLFCCLFIIVTTQFVALYEPCKPKPKPKPSTYDTRTTTPWQRSKFRYLDRSQSNKYAINMQIQTISVSK